MHKRIRRRRAPVVSVLALALLGALSMPALAADPSCVDANGDPVAGNTDLGAENATTAPGDPANNTTCDYDASAFGQNNNASGWYSNAFGYENKAFGGYSSAFGYKNEAFDLYSNAFGYGNTASRTSSSAFGTSNTASGDYSSAFGIANTASGQSSSAFGFNGIASGTGSVALSGWRDLDADGYFDPGEAATASGLASVAVGTGTASGDYATAVGMGNAASSDYSSAFGFRNDASGNSSSAFGFRNTADASQSSAFGFMNTASGYIGSAFGFNNTASGAGSNAFGYSNTASGSLSSAFGYYNTASGADSSAFGFNGLASGEGSVVLAGWYDRNGNGGVDVGVETGRASGKSAVAVGAGAVALGDYSAAVGVNVRADALYSTAIGFGAVADEQYTVAVGEVGGQMNRIVHMADGIDDYDAVNMRQLNAAIAAGAVDFSPFAAAFGGGAAWNGGIFTPPSYTIQGMSYGNVGDALAAIDSWMTSNANGIQYDDPSHATATLDGASGTQIKNVADGTDAMDAVNKGQMDAGDVAALGAANTYTDARETAIRTDMAAGDAATLASANLHADAGDAATLTASKTYTDTKAASTLQSANAYTDQKFAAWNDSFAQFQQQTDRRFAQTDRRIDRIGAMGTAMTQMAVNAALGGSPRGRIAIGIGSQGGQGAVSIGYGKRVGDRGSFSLGASFAGGESSAGAGFGFDL